MWDKTKFTSKDNARWWEDKNTNIIVMEKTISKGIDSKFYNIDSFVA